MIHFKSKRVRLVLRNTAQYAKLLFESYHPLLLHDVEKRRDHFNWLTSDIQGTILEKIVNSELKDTSEGNIPIFSCMSDGYDVVDSFGKKLDIYVFKSGYCIRGFKSAYKWRILLTA